MKPKVEEKPEKVDRKKIEEGTEDFDFHNVRIIPLYGQEKSTSGGGEKNNEPEPEIPLDY